MGFFGAQLRHDAPIGKTNHPHPCVSPLQHIPYVQCMPYKRAVKPVPSALPSSCGIESTEKPMQAACSSHSPKSGAQWGGTWICMHTHWLCWHLCHQPSMHTEISKTENAAPQAEKPTALRIFCPFLDCRERQLVGIKSDVSLKECIIRLTPRCLVRASCEGPAGFRGGLCV